MMLDTLYHTIGRWTLTQRVSEDEITPSCNRNVFFFPHTLHEFLKDKPKG